MTIKKNIIITGAGGMIGPMLAKRLLNDGYHLILTDLVEPKVITGVKHPENAKYLKGDICDQTFVKQLLEAAQPLHAIFIFHGIMSAGSEANYDLVSLNTRFPWPITPEIQRNHGLWATLSPWSKADIGITSRTK